MTIKIETRHFKSATAFINHKSCPLAQAVKELFPEYADVICITPKGICFLKPNPEYFPFSGWSENEETPMNISLIDTYIKQANKGLDIRTFYVEAPGMEKMLIGLKRANNASKTIYERNPSKMFANLD